MAKMTTYTFGENNWNPDASLSKAFFDSLNCPLLNTTIVNDYDFTIQFDDSIILKSYGYGNPGAKITIIDHENEMKISDFHGAYGSKTYTVIYTDSMFFLRYKGISFQYEGYDFIYEKIDDKKIYGIEYGTSMNISNLIYEDYIGRTKYQKNKPLITYSVSSGTIDYLDHDAFLVYNYGDNRNPVKKILDDPNMLSTTTLTPRQTISFGGKNYYVLGPNSIVEIEE